MFSFFKRKVKPQIIVPPSMAFFEPDQYGDFQAAVEGYFQSKNIAFSWLDGAISVAANDFGFGELGLMNLAQRCKQAPKDAYADLVNGHFESMVRGSLFQNEFEAKSHDFEYAKKYVGVRIYPDDYFPESHKDMVMGKQIAAGIYAMMVLDFPDTVSNLQPKDAEKWEHSFDELFELGLENIRRNYEFPVAQEDIDELSIWVCHHEHFFVTNLVLDLAIRKELVGPFGAIVGLPTRHLMFGYPITSARVVVAITQLAVIVHGAYNDGPGAVSNQLYWFRDGQILDLPIKIEGDAIQFFPPIEFLEMLEQLAE